MGIKEGVCEFTPFVPVVYKHKGSDAVADVVELREPGMEHIKYYLRLKQMVTQCQMELAKQADDFSQIQDKAGTVIKPVTEDTAKIENEADTVAEGLTFALLTSTTVDIADFITTFRNMACLPAKRRLCMLNHEVAMTKAIWETMRPDDVFNMAVRWCAFFGMPSIGGVQTTSEQQPELPQDHKVV